MSSGSKLKRFAEQCQKYWQCFPLGSLKLDDVRKTIVLSVLQPSAYNHWTSDAYLCCTLLSSHTIVDSEAILLSAYFFMSMWALTLKRRSIWLNVSYPYVGVSNSLIMYSCIIFKHFYILHTNPGCPSLPFFRIPPLLIPCPIYSSEQLNLP